MEDKVRSRVSRYREGSCGGLWEFLEVFTRFWGIATAVVLSGVGIEMCVHRQVAGVFIIFSSIVIFFLEVMWVITLFIDLFTNENEYSRLWRFWDNMLRCRSARRAPMYIGGALVLVAWPGWLWPARVASGLLMLLGLLHAVNALRPKPPAPLLPRQRHRLVTDTNSDCGNERYDDITEVLDDTFPTPIAVNNVHAEMTVAPSIKDQETILEI
ncbi:uncharacterized protein LOC143916945 [Arctopsyche grandis]|uniref:uncharacterized protein LOC143916945 n=1 Tax=Arctopsyche grandis TaxID=121162 RepID=UPI00406D8F07